MNIKKLSGIPVNPEEFYSVRLFNPKTIIIYQLAVRGFTLLKVFAISEKKVATLVDGKQNDLRSKPKN